jgi:putative aldouronate transport system permease protein
MWRERWMYVLILPGFLYFVVFRYVPLLGNVAAWQDYSPFLGFRRSPWVGWANFEHIFTDPELIHALRNTLVLSTLQLVFAFPAPLALALLLNSIVSSRVRRGIQMVVYLPHFIGWVIAISIWNEMLGPLGVVNHVLHSLGLPAARRHRGQPVDVLDAGDVAGDLERGRLGDDHLPRRDNQHSAGVVRVGGD